MNLEPMENPLPEVYTRLTPPMEYEEATRSLLPSWQKNFTSDDYVDYTWHAPTVRLFTGRPMLAVPRPGYEYPTWAYLAMGGNADLIDPGMILASQTIASTILDLLTVPGELDMCKAEFEQRTGGGVGGSRWVAPLLPADFFPPIDLRWPEYISTARGEEWWLPTPNPSARQLID